MNLSSDNKHLFAAYANMAYDNFSDIVTYIAKKESFNKSNDGKKFIKDFIEEFEVCNDKLKIERVIKSLTKSFPSFVCFINCIRETDRESSLQVLLVEIIGCIYENLEKWRNFTTHYAHAAVENKNVLDVKFEALLNSTYNDGLLKLEKRFKVTKDQTGHLNINSEGCYYKLFNENNEFTNNGLAYFLCLFLYKRDAFSFLRQFSGFKKSDNLNFRLTLEQFTVMRFYSVKRMMKLNNKNFDNDTFALDLFNELTKCPQEIFKCLSEEDKKIYNVSLDNDTDLEEDQEIIIGERVRRRDRFEILAMQILERSQECKNLGFYISLGKCFMNKYPKTFADGSKGERYITMPVCGFGKLTKSKNISSVHDDGNNEFTGDEYLSVYGKELYKRSKIPVIHSSYDDNEDVQPEYKLPYIKESYPSYIINDNKIGIKVLEQDVDMIYPSFVLPTENSLGKVHCPKADFWLSKYKLVAMAFYVYLKEKHGLTDFPSVIKILNDDADKIAARDIKGKTLSKEAKLKRLESYIDDVKFKIKRIEDQTDEDYVRDGKMADELAKDIIWLQPSVENGRDKLTGGNYRLLQAALAQYPLRKGDLTQIFKNVNLTEVPLNRKHPFLDKVNPLKYQSLSTFYLDYLKCKKKYLEGVSEKIIKGKNNLLFHPFRFYNSDRKINISNRSDSIFLSDKIFNEEIKNAISKVSAGCLSDDLSYANTAWLIFRYIQKINDDNLPEIYNKLRGYIHYKDDEKLLFCTPEERMKIIKKYKLNNSKKNPKGNISSRIRNIIDNERLIRMRGTQDIVMFLWMAYLMPQNMISLFGDGANAIKLNKISNELLGRSINFQRIVRHDTVDNAKEWYQRDFRNISDKDKYIIRINGNVKVRDFGRISSLENEKLSLSLISLIDKFYEGKKLDLSYDYIHREITAFESYRPEIFRFCHEIELKICDSYPDRVKKVDESFYRFSGLIKIFKKYNKPSAPIIDNLTNLRNSFCHNDYPHDKEESFKEAISQKVLVNVINTDMNKKENTIAHYLYLLFEEGRNKICCDES